jgi:hypothetical protein
VSSVALSLASITVTCALAGTHSARIPLSSPTPFSPLRLPGAEKGFYLEPHAARRGGPVYLDRPRVHVRSGRVTLDTRTLGRRVGRYDTGADVGTHTIGGHEMAGPNKLADRRRGERRNSSLAVFVGAYDDLSRLYQRKHRDAARPTVRTPRAVMLANGDGSPPASRRTPMN